MSLLCVVFKFINTIVYFPHMSLFLFKDNFVFRIFVYCFLMLNINISLPYLLTGWLTFYDMQVGVILRETLFFTSVRIVSFTHTEVYMYSFVDFLLFCLFVCSSHQAKFKCIDTYVQLFHYLNFYRYSILSQSDEIFFKNIIHSRNEFMEIITLCNFQLPQYIFISLSRCLVMLS